MSLKDPGSIVRGFGFLLMLKRCFSLGCAIVISNITVVMEKFEMGLIGLDLSDFLMGVVRDDMGGRVRTWSGGWRRAFQGFGYGLGWWDDVAFGFIFGVCFGWGFLCFGARG